MGSISSQNKNLDVTPEDERLAPGPAWRSHGLRRTPQAIPLPRGASSAAVPADVRAA